MWLILIIGTLAVTYSVACPDGCSCDFEIIDCVGLNLSDLTEGIDLNVSINKSCHMFIITLPIISIVKL